MATTEGRGRNSHKHENSLRKTILRLVDFYPINFPINSIKIVTLKSISNWGFYDVKTIFLFDFLAQNAKFPRNFWMFRLELWAIFKNHEGSPNSN